MPCTSAVLPAPSGPVSSTRSPGRSTAARRRPNSRVSSTVASRMPVYHEIFSRNGISAALTSSAFSSMTT